MRNISAPVKIIGHFSKDKDYALAEAGDRLVALYRYDAVSNTCERAHEAKWYAGQIGIGPEIDKI